MWFCGITPNLSVAIWFGYIEEVPVRVGGGLGHPYNTAVPLFGDFINLALGDAGVADFPDATGTINFKPNDSWIFKFTSADANTAQTDTLETLETEETQEQQTQTQHENHNQNANTHEHNSGGENPNQPGNENPNPPRPRPNPSPSPNPPSPNPGGGGNPGGHNGGQSPNEH